MLNSIEVTPILTLDEIEKEYILRILALCEGNRVLASSLLGIDRKTLYNKLDRYDYVKEEL